MLASSTSTSTLAPPPAPLDAPELLATLDDADLRWALVKFVIVSAIDEGDYDARTRVTVRKLVRHLQLDWAQCVTYEDYLAVQLRAVAASTLRVHACPVAPMPPDDAPSSLAVCARRPGP